VSKSSASGSDLRTFDWRAGCCALRGEEAQQGKQRHQRAHAGLGTRDRLATNQASQHDRGQHAQPKNSDADQFADCQVGLWRWIQRALRRETLDELSQTAHQRRDDALAERHRSSISSSEATCSRALYSASRACSASFGSRALSPMRIKTTAKPIATSNPIPRNSIARSLSR
jgi:hypothetical protein